MAATKMQTPRRARKSPPPLVLLPAEPRPETEAAWRHLCSRMQAAYHRNLLEKLVRRGGDLADLAEAL